MATTYLTRTLGTPTNNKRWTFSAWVKKSHVGSDINTLFGAGGSSTNFASIWVNYNNGQIQFQSQTSGGVTGGSVRLLNLLRDVAAWYHLVVSFDSANSTAADRVKIYINGIRGTNFDGTAYYPNLNIASFINSNIEHIIGKDSYRSAGYYDGSMANVEFVDGQAYDPSYFGSTNTATGIWTPSGATAISNYGTNGFKLKMDTTSPGADTSGKGNTFTASGSPTLLQGNPQNNWCTLNPLAYFFGTAHTFSNGNTTVASSSVSGSINPSSATLGITTGKWYWEGKLVTAPGSNYALIGIMAQAPAAAGGQNFLGGVGDQYGYAGWNGTVYNSAGSTGNTSGGATYGVGDILSIAVDADNNRLYYYKNGTIQNSGTGIVIPAAADTPFGAWIPAVGDWDTPSHVWSCNFGEGFFGTTAAGTNADGNGQGLFAYAVPSGYYAMNTKNLEAYG